MTSQVTKGYLRVNAAPFFTPSFSLLPIIVAIPERINANEQQHIAFLRIISLKFKFKRCHCSTSNTKRNCKHKDCFTCLELPVDIYGGCYNIVITYNNLKCVNSIANTCKQAPTYGYITIIYLKIKMSLNRYYVNIFMIEKIIVL